MRMRGTARAIGPDADRGQRLFERDVGNERARLAHDDRLGAHGPPLRRVQIASAVVSAHTRSSPSKEMHGLSQSIVTGSWPIANMEQTLADIAAVPFFRGAEVNAALWFLR